MGVSWALMEESVFCTDSLVLYGIQGSRNTVYMTIAGIRTVVLPYGYSYFNLNRECFDSLGKGYETSAFAS